MTAPSARPSSNPFSVALVATLGLGLLGALSTPAARAGPEGASVLDGSWAKAYEAALDEAVPWRDGSIAGWGALQFFAFGDARPGALLGRDGWLFSDEEFQPFPDEEAEVAHKLRVMQRSAAALSERGAALVVALVPAKARVCAEQLGGLVHPTPERYGRVRDALLEAGLIVPDLVAALSELSCERAFLRTDTHWTPEGARTAAAAVVRAARAVVPSTELPSVAFTTEVAPPAAREGDLMRYLPLGPWQGLGPPPDQLRAETTSQAETVGGEDAAAALFGGASEPVVTLVGTSYSHNPTWNFAGALRDALQADVLNMAQEGQGPFVPMVQWLASDASSEAPPPAWSCGRCPSATSACTTKAWTGSLGRPTNPNREPLHDGPPASSLAARRAAARHARGGLRGLPRGP